MQTAHGLAKGSDYAADLQLRGSGRRHTPSFHEDFNDGSVVFASACHKPCVKVDDFPCTHADERTQFAFYNYYPFSVTWTTRWYFAVSHAILIMNLMLRARTLSGVSRDITVWETHYGHRPNVGEFLLGPFG